MPSALAIWLMKSMRVCLKLRGSWAIIFGSAAILAMASTILSSLTTASISSADLPSSFTLYPCAQSTASCRSGLFLASFFRPTIIRSYRGLFEFLIALITGCVNSCHMTTPGSALSIACRLNRILPPLSIATNDPSVSLSVPGFLLRNSASSKTSDCILKSCNDFAAVSMIGT